MFQLWTFFVVLLGKVEGFGQILSEQAMKPSALTVPVPYPHSNNRRLSQVLNNENYYVIQVFGGALCNGPVHELIIVKVDTCFKYYDLQDRGKNPGHAYDDPQKAPSNLEFSIQVKTVNSDDDGGKETLVKEYFENSDANKTFCDDPGVDATEQTRNFILDSVKGYYNPNQYSASEQPAPVIGECTKLKVSYDSKLQVYLYSSVLVSRLEEFTSWAPTVHDMALHESLSKGKGYIGTAGVNSKDEDNGGIFYYKPANTNMCIRQTGNVNSYHSNSASDYTAEGTAEYDITSALAGLNGPHGIYSGNKYLFPMASGQNVYQSVKMTCHSNGGWKVTYFLDEGCGEKIWTADYPGSIQYEYLSYAGSASNAYFLNNQGAQTYSDYTHIYHKMQCSGVGLQDYPREGMGTKNLLEANGNFKWAYANFYEDENCEGAVYARDSMNAGLLYQCLPDMDSKVNGFFTRSYYISCGNFRGPENPEAGFEKRYFSDMECESAPLDVPDVLIPKATSSQAVKDTAFTYDSPYANNGTCFMYSFVNNGGPASYQAQSWRYVCSKAPPARMGYSIVDYTNTDCRGIVKSIKTYSLTLGSNDSAPSQDPEAIPNHASYRVSSICNNSNTITTWSAQNDEQVEIVKYKAYIPARCSHNSLTAVDHSSTYWACDNFASPKEDFGLTPGETAAVVLCTLLFMFFLVYQFFLTFVYEKLRQREQIIPESDVPNLESISATPEEVQKLDDSTEEVDNTDIDYHMNPLRFGNDDAVIDVVPEE